MIACEYDKAVLCLHSYSIMQKCWEADCRKRPSFSQLQTTFAAMLSSAQNATYINLNVDEMLPCYGMNTAVEDEECELSGRDFHPSLTVVGGEGGSTDGYRTLEADDAGLEGYRTLEAGDAGLEGYRTLEAGDAGLGGYRTLEAGDAGLEGYRTLEAGDAGLGRHRTLEAGDAGLRGYRTLEAGVAGLGGYRTLECERGANDSTAGYHTLEGGNDDDSLGGYRALERGDDSSIASAEVVVLDAAGEATVEQHA